MHSAVLVTGGAGYIGSHTCKALADAGFEPVTIDNLVYGHRSAVKWGPLIEGDLADSNLLDKTLRKYRPLGVIHFAAYAYVGESMRDPGKYFRNNVCGSVNLLEAMARNGCNCVVFSSTCATYGVPEHIPIDEQSKQQPVNPYGESKLAVERTLWWYWQCHKIKYAALRYFNAAGADAAGEIGEAHDPETHLIPLTIEAALGLRDHVEVYGSDYETPDGTAIRDYIHVTDLADAHVRSLTCLLDKGQTMTLNLGTGRGHSVREVISAVELAAGNKVPVKAAPRRPGDPPVLVAESSLAQSTLGWKPKHSSLKEIVTSAWRWHSKQCGANLQES
jgi:UDP-glucose-4-epimerase GalE